MRSVTQKFITFFTIHKVHHLILAFIHFFCVFIDRVVTVPLLVAQLQLMLYTKMLLIGQVCINFV